MSKKKESTPADALKDLLLDDAKSDDSSSSDSLFSHLSKSAPIGLSPDAENEKYEGPSAGSGNFQSPTDIFGSNQSQSQSESPSEQPTNAVDEKTIPLPSLERSAPPP